MRPPQEPTGSVTDTRVENATSSPFPVLESQKQDIQAVSHVKYGYHDGNQRNDHHFKMYHKLIGSRLGPGSAGSSGTALIHRQESFMSHQTWRRKASPARFNLMRGKIVHFKTYSHQGSVLFQDILINIKITTVYRFKSIIYSLDDQISSGIHFQR